MTTQQTEPVIVIKQGNTILIAEPVPKNEKPLSQVLKGYFTKDPVSQEIDKEGVRAFGDDTFVPAVQGQKNTWTNLFSRQKMSQCKHIMKQKCDAWKGIDTKWANDISKFKQDHILSIGDVRIRSVLMAFSSAVLYKTISWNTVGLLRKTRNLGVSFVVMGYVFVPELFNPFLKKQSIAKLL